MEALMAFSVGILVAAIAGRVARARDLAAERELARRGSLD